MSLPANLRTSETKPAHRLNPGDIIRAIQQDNNTEAFIHRGCGVRQVPYCLLVMQADKERPGIWCCLAVLHTRGNEHLEHLAREKRTCAASKYLEGNAVRDYDILWGKYVHIAMDGTMVSFLCTARLSA